MDSLEEIYQRYSTVGDVGVGDKGTVHSYIPHYERLLAPYREKCTLMEIGIASGLSMRLWGDYFGPESKLVGVDLSITFDTTSFDERFYFAATDATLPGVLKEIDDFQFDVIIDDGSHMSADQAATFNLLKHRMKPGGLYIIEDILSINSTANTFRSLHTNCEILDLRGIKGRFDDVLVIYRF